MSDKIILEHYAKLSKGWGLQGQMSMQDKVVRERETTFITAQTQHCLRTLGVAPEQALVLDVGCGNGYLLAALWEELAGAELRGIEFVPELVALAQTRTLPGLTVESGDMRLRASFKKQAHVVITERSVVNLLSWEEQKSAFENIAAWIRPGGYYIMVESFQEPWAEMNAARRENNLPEVPISAHNRYLKEACIDTLGSLGLRVVPGVEPKNALSSHFFLSRVFQHLLTHEGRTASERVWQFFAEGLPTNVGNYSPILFRVFQKDCI
jgi:2-polyprenyl-3-methyl-5-hydroxy-6-metoxy-1,4-benzoquinol methylase